MFLNTTLNSKISNSNFFLSGVMQFAASLVE